MSPIKDTHPAAGTSIRRCVCSTWNDFTIALDPYLIPPPSQPLFRGHSNSDWLLSSPWERWLRRSSPDGWTYKRFTEALDRILKSFREAAIGLPGFRSEPLTENDWWAIGRHHGLLTPLLDWTRSPYVAAFFAFSEHAEQHLPGFKAGRLEAHPSCDHTVVVWRLDYVDDLCRRKHFEVIATRRDEFHRQKAQQAVFTRLTDPNQYELESYLLSRRRARALLRYELPGSEMWEALDDLARMNINFGTLFPDLHGAAIQANIDAGRLMLNIEGVF